MIFDTFKDTVFVKKTSNLERKYEALERLVKEYPNNDKLKEELFIVKKGLDGEKQIEYQLKKANLGLYVLHDINLKYEDMTAQIDYIVVTKLYIYFIECKNLIGNITVDDKGDFIREYTYDDKTVNKGMYSPLRQVEAQRDVYKKIWNNSLSNNKVLNKLKRMLAEKNFKKYHRVLVVAANNETILNTKSAPDDIKDKVIKVDSLVRKLEQELEKTDKDLWESEKEIKGCANFFLKINKEDKTDYYVYYKDKYLRNELSDDELRKKLLEFRKKRSKEMKIPAYYIFTDKELESIIALKPKKWKDLEQVLPEVKVKTHGNKIIDVLKNK